MRYKVAFVGAGYMATEHMKAFADVSNVELAGVYSRNRSRAEEVAAKYSLSGVFDSVQELYERTHADILVVAVSELAAREVCLAAFEFPWLCLIEKPAGYNLAQAGEIASAARKNKNGAFLALNRRHYSSTRAVLKDIEGYGSRRLVHVYDQENPLVEFLAGQPEEVVDNWMFANSLHVIDYFSLFCRGDLISIDTLSEWKPSRSCFVLAKLGYSTGDIGVYEAVWEGPGPWAVTVTNHMRRWELRPLERAMFQDYLSRELKSIPVHVWDREFKPGLRLQAEEALKARSGRPHNLPTLDDGLKVMNVVAYIYGK